MKKILISGILIYLLNAQSNDAVITMYKDQIALIKQPVLWELESEQKTITWDLLPGGIVKDSPGGAEQWKTYTPESKDMVEEETNEFLDAFNKGLFNRSFVG